MDHPPFWTRALARASEVQGSLLLTNASVLLLGAWASFGVAAPPQPDDAATRHPLALEEYYDACHGGDLTACNNLGVAYQRGYGTEPDERVALDVFASACRAGHAEACSNQGALLERAAAPDADLTPVRAAYSRACDGGAGLGCSNLGALHAIGKGVAVDMALALWYFDRACQLGSPIGCENQAILHEEAARHAAISP